jgi:ribonucleoside-triphosphate reductase (thioredoxin)
VMRNRRIGCSQSGIIDSFSKHGKREHLRWCDEGYKYLRKLDRVYSDWLCVPLSRKITSVKPSGTVSLLPGVSPGIHYPHSEFYYRTIRIGKGSPLAESLRVANYRVEDALEDPNSVVAYFPVHEKHFDRSKTQVSMWEQLENAAAMQSLWADNQVSITVTFKPEESADIKQALELYETRLKSVSFLPMEEHGYVQAPYQTISKDEYDEAVKHLKPVSYKQSTHEVTDAYCDGDFCAIKTDA